KCLNGLYAVKAGDDYVSFRVEEYKRPTFYVEIEKPTTAYKKGETLTLTGKALGYNGVPVQGAKVSYQVRCSRVFYWWRDYKNGDEGAGVYDGEATTGADGSFQMQVPLLLNAYGGRDDYYRFTVTAQVTDQGGESQQGECSIPLSSKERMINVDIPQKVLRDSLKTITVNVVNAMGQPVKEHVSFTIQQLYPKEQGLLGRSWIGGDMANEPFDLTRMPNLQDGFPSGAYQIEAYCGNNTIRRQFVVFDLKDTHLAAPTKDWFYVSKEEFPEDGSPVYVQVGSSDADIHVLYTVTTGEKVLNMGRFDLSNEIKTMTFNYKEEYQEGISVAMCWVKDTVFYRHEAVISRPLPKKELKMEWTTFRDKLTPGQKETWTLRVRQPNGKPVSAQVMATLYDKSLDQLKGHQWLFDHRLDQNTPSASWNMGYIYDISDTERAKQNIIKVNNLQYDKMDQWLFEDRMDRLVAFAGSEARPETMQAREVIYIEEQKTPEKETVSAEGLSVRENLSETAFFYPALVTDANGQVALRFTLPESLTTWRFMGLAHDKEMNIAQLVADAVASKTVMVQPNVPRFVRQNDQAAIVSRIVNTSAKTVSGQALLELLDPVTEQVVFSQQLPYTIAPNGQSSVTHNISALTQDGKSLMNIRPLICRVTVKGQGYSDGEQHYLPILPDVEQVVNTRAITQHHPGDVNVDLTKLFAGNRLADVTP
ncbi:MAG: alpha-2-macroglobulin, partial [Prevotella sp.]|nr:alpha-2-macroglobulin [Prevotella sp.]